MVSYIRPIRQKKSSNVMKFISVWARGEIVWSALSSREVCQTACLFSSVRLGPVGPITDERLTSYLYLAENRVCVRGGCPFRACWMVSAGSQQETERERRRRASHHFTSALLCERSDTEIVEQCCTSSSSIGWTASKTKKVKSLGLSVPAIKWTFHSPPTHTLRLNSGVVSRSHRSC